MTDHVVRLYALAATVFGFFVTWAVVAAHPWQAQAGPQPSSVVSWSRLDALQQRLERDAVLVAHLTRQRAAATLPRIVAEPPVTSTRTS